MFGVFLGRDIGEVEVLLLLALFVAHLSLHVEAHHQLVDDHANDGAQEGCKGGHQEPAVSSPGALAGKKVLSTCGISGLFSTDHVH